MKVINGESFREFWSSKWVNESRELYISCHVLMIRDVVRQKWTLFLCSVFMYVCCCMLRSAYSLTFGFSAVYWLLAFKQKAEWVSDNCQHVSMVCVCVRFLGCSQHSQYVFSGTVPALPVSTGNTDTYWTYLGTTLTIMSLKCDCASPYFLIYINMYKHS